MIRLLWSFIGYLLAKVDSGVCRDDSDCSLNGLCLWGACRCDAPWTGQCCAELAVKPSPVSAKSLYPEGQTWGGPILCDELYHLYMPIYEEGSLFHTIDMLHGTSDDIGGPYEWQSMGFNDGINPALLTYPDKSDGKIRYALWIGGQIRVSKSPYGPFALLENVSYPQPNPAPIYFEGSFYLTNQHTKQIWTSQSIEGPWDVYAIIDVGNGQAILEDPTMWIDRRRNWHIINHAYNTSEYNHCSKSVVSAHLYSLDGKKWHQSPGQPYGHVIEFEDGTHHTYSTLERPFVVVDGKGQLSHLVLSADLITGDEGCWNITGCVDRRHCSCVNCKYSDKAGTVVMSLHI